MHQNLSEILCVVWNNILNSVEQKKQCIFNVEGNINKKPTADVVLDIPCDDKSCYMTGCLS